jgi:hypothetical protein
MKCQQCKIEAISVAEIFKYETGRTKKKKDDIEGYMVVVLLSSNC